METATQALHRLTSYELPWEKWTEPADDPRVVQDLEVNDISRLPWFYKRYAPSLPRVALPRELPATTEPVVKVLAGIADISPRELDLSHLSRLLHLSAGVVRIGKRAYGDHPFRAAGSAGGRFPLELYVAVPNGGAMPAGVHWYDPEDHALVQVGPAPNGTAPTIVVTGIPWRTGWRYRERGYRHVYWDAGTMLAQLLAVGDSAGLDPQLYTFFPDATVAALVGGDRVHEWPVAVISLGDGEPALEATGTAVVGEIDPEPLEFPLITAAQSAGESDAMGSPWERGEPVDVSTQRTDPVETVVLARGSQRRMDAARGLPESMLRASMQVALRGIGLPHFVVVHDVDDIAPGVYRWPDLSTPVRSGAMRDELYRVAMDQPLARDAAFVVIGATDISALDDRGYREAQLASGLVEGRLHLLAYAQGASATGMTFIDTEIPALLGRPLDALLFTCIGVPKYASSAGGPPGAPTEVRTPASE